MNLGAVVARPGDVVQVTGAVPGLAFDASAEGIPAGVQVDAVAEAADGSMLVSFDVTVLLDGITFGDEDVVRLDAGTGAASLAFDGSARGTATGLDLDAVDELSNGNLLLSFDGSGALGGVNFDDEDLVEFDPVALTFAMNYDGSAEHAAWSASDLDAAPPSTPRTPMATASPTPATTAQASRTRPNSILAASASARPRMESATPASAATSTAAAT